MDAVKVGKYLFMETSQLLIEADGVVALGLGAFSLVGTAGTVLTLIKLLCSAVVVAPERYGTQKKEFPVVGTQQIAVLIYPEVDCSKRIIPIFLVGIFFLIDFYYKSYPLYRV